MFSLILTIISIALVAALSLATIYYGGAAFNKSDAQAQSAKLQLQAQQLLGAADLFRANNNRWPNSMQELVDENYLKTIPVAYAPPLGVTEVVAAGSPWAMPTPGVPVFVNAGISESVCTTFNNRFHGTSGVSSKVHLNLAVQCYGPTRSNLQIVAAREPSRLQDVFGATNVSSAGLPSTDTDPSWTIRPGQSVGSPISEVPSGIGVLGYSSYEFSPTTVGIATANKVVTLSNTGTGPLAISGASVTGPFTIAANSCGSVLLANASCDISVSENVSAAGTLNGVLTIATASGPLTATLSGVVSPPAVSYGLKWDWANKETVGDDYLTLCRYVGTTAIGCQPPYTTDNMIYVYLTSNDASNPVFTASQIKLIGAEPSLSYLHIGGVGLAQNLGSSYGNCGTWTGLTNARGESIEKINCTTINWGPAIRIAISVPYGYPVNSDVGSHSVQLVVRDNNGVDLVAPLTITSSIAMSQ